MINHRWRHSILLHFWAFRDIIFEVFDYMRRGILDDVFEFIKQFFFFLFCNVTPLPISWHTKYISEHLVSLKINETKRNKKKITKLKRSSTNRNVFGGDKKIMTFLDANLFNLSHARLISCTSRFRVIMSLHKTNEKKITSTEINEVMRIVFFSYDFRIVQRLESASIAFWHKFYISVFILLLFAVFSALFLMKRKKKRFLSASTADCAFPNTYSYAIWQRSYTATTYIDASYFVHMYYTVSAARKAALRDSSTKATTVQIFFSLLHSLFNCFIFMGKTCDVHKIRSLVQNPTRQFSPTRNLHEYSLLLCHRIYYRIAKRKTWLLCNTQKFWRLRETHEKNRSHSEFANEVFYAGKWEIFEDTCLHLCSCNYPNGRSHTNAHSETARTVRNGDKYV